jgi:hypothetical protein
MCPMAFMHIRHVGALVVAPAYRVDLSQPVLEILIFLGFFTASIFANFDTLDASNGRNSVIYGPI